MRKIPRNLENPIDDYLLDLSEYISPTFYKLGFTPNKITTLSNISTIIVVLLLLKAQYIWAAFFVLVAYFFDCLDGHFARKYNMVSSWGDYYDHVSDTIKFISILSTLYYINSEKFIKLIPIWIIFTILAVMHIGCQELHYSTNESQTLSFAENLCPVDKNNTADIENKLAYTRFFGFGTHMLVLMASIIYYDF